jgi:hypothetical protein
MSSRHGASPHDHAERIRIAVGSIALTGVLELGRAPTTCAAFRTLLPLRTTLLHARWSGEATWVPLGDLTLGIGSENPIHEPAPGQLLFYPGGASETEILLPYGTARFAARSGPLSGNHFLTILDADVELGEIGRRALWDGAQPVVFEALA